MEYRKEQIQEMGKIEANDKKHEHIKLDYQDGIYYGFQQGFEKALSLFAVSGQLPNNLILYRQAKKLDYAEFCKWLNAKLGNLR